MTVSYDKLIEKWSIEAAKLLNIVDDLSAAFGYTTIIPPWELESAPEEWAATLSSFDEVWGISNFTTKALSRVHSSVKYSADRKSTR